MIRKFIAFIISCMMLVGVIPQVSFADDSDSNLGQVVKFEDFENVPDDQVGFHSSNVKYCEFGSYSKKAVISEEKAYSGASSLKIDGRYSGLSSLKCLDVFGKTLDSSDIGTTYLISFMLYADKDKGVYSQNGSSLEDTRDKFSATDEELNDSLGTEITVTMAGPNGKNYMHRTGSSYTKEYFVPWNQWTEISYTYTVMPDTIPTGSEDSLSDPYIDSFRISQNRLTGNINEMICDTFYIDDLRVRKAGASIDYSIRGNDVYVITKYAPMNKEKYSRTFIFEYSPDGKLLGSKIGEKVVTNISTMVGNTSKTEYVRKSPDSKIFAASFGEDITKPQYPKTELKTVPEIMLYPDVKYAKKRAKEMLELSKAEYKDALPYEERLNNENAYFFSTDDLFADSSKPEESQRRSASVKVSDKYTGLIKFDISSVKDKSTSHAYIVLYPSDVKKGGSIDVYAYPHTWDEDTLTYSSMNEKGELITSFNTDYAQVVSYVDVSSYMNKALLEGKTEVSFAFVSDECDVVFISKETSLKSFRPSLILEGVGLKQGEKKVSSFDTSNYVDVMKRKVTPKDAFVPTPTRNLDSVKDFTKVSKAPELNRYGSWIDGGKYEATGFFRTELIDGRWWIIDPDGYKQMHIAVSRVEADKSTKFNEAQKKGFEEKYGTDENWANLVCDDLRPYGFNAAGPWSDYDIMLKATERTPLVQAGYKANFIKGYDKAVSSNEDDNMLNVFDPQFEEHADRLARIYFAPFSDSPYILGWITDNEPMANSSMLASYLNCDKNQKENVYNYYTAWEWFKARHGENAKITDITEADKDDWVEFVFDRYMKVCHDAIRKYDKNHMIIGPKLDKPSKGSFRGISRWVDIIGYDYYGNAWDGDMAQIEQWYLWGGKPLINAEWYVKGMDAITDENDLTNESGVGWTVQTQKERGDYYQSFVLDMIESKVFVGWQWFRYTDNLGGRDSDGPDVNSNKGIYTRDYKPWPVILEAMKDINENAYALTQHFDK